MEGCLSWKVPGPYGCIIPHPNRMRHTRESGPTLRARLLELLKRNDFDLAEEEICRFPLRSAVNPLFSLIQQGDERIKWAAVRAMGTVVSKLANQDMEAARIIMRRLMWNLNDESGGIGWGSPEAIGEILAKQDGLAREYAHILISYAREDGNYLENEVLQTGVLWGIGRLGEVHPDLVTSAVPHVIPFLSSSSASHRGLAARIIGYVPFSEARPALERLVEDKSTLTVFKEGRLEKRMVGEMAKEALDRFS